MLAIERVQHSSNGVGLAGARAAEKNGGVVGESFYYCLCLVVLGAVFKYIADPSVCLSGKRGGCCSEACAQCNGHQTFVGPLASEIQHVAKEHEWLGVVNMVEVVGFWHEHQWAGD